MEGITLEMLFRREREIAGAANEVKSMIGYLQAQKADEEAKAKKAAEAEKKPEE